MKELIEIRIHGRGGQGVKKSAMLLGRAASIQGFQSQDFAIYGAEREGAPVVSFVRISKKPIRVVGYIEEPEYVIVLDESIGLKKPLEGVKKHTKVLINSNKKINKKNFYSVDATEIAMEIIGRPIANIALLGAFTKIFPTISFDSFKKAVEIEMRKHANIVEKNIAAARKCRELL